MRLSEVLIQLHHFLPLCSLLFVSCIYIFLHYNSYWIMQMYLYPLAITQNYVLYSVQLKNGWDGLN